MNKANARDSGRLTAVRDLMGRGAAAVIGDLSGPADTIGVAGQVNTLGSWTR
jgi:hypothetical protein